MASPVGPLNSESLLPVDVPANVDTAPLELTRLTVLFPEAATIMSPFGVNAMLEGVSRPDTNSDAAPPEIRQIFPAAPSETYTSSPFTAIPNGSPIPLSGPAIALTDLKSTAVVSVFQHDAENSKAAQTNNAADMELIVFRGLKAIKLIYECSAGFGTIILHFSFGRKNKETALCFHFRTF